MVAHTQYIYIITIHKISVGPTKVDLITHNIRLEGKYISIQLFYLDTFCWLTLYRGIRWPTICFLRRQIMPFLISPASYYSLTPLFL